MSDEYAASAVIQDTVRVNVYAVITDAVERGITRGYRRAHKHDDHPKQDQLEACIYEAVMSEICEVIVFP